MWISKDASFAVESAGNKQTIDTDEIDRVKTTFFPFSFFYTEGGANYMSLCIKQKIGTCLVTRVNTTRTGVDHKGLNMETKERQTNKKTSTSVKGYPKAQKF